MIALHMAVVEVDYILTSHWIEDNLPWLKGPGLASTSPHSNNSFSFSEVVLEWISFTIFIELFWMNHIRGSNDFSTLLFVFFGCFIKVQSLVDWVFVFLLKIQIIVMAINKYWVFEKHWGWLIYEQRVSQSVDLYSLLLIASQCAAG